MGSGLRHGVDALQRIVPGHTATFLLVNGLIHEVSDFNLYELVGRLRQEVRGACMHAWMRVRVCVHGLCAGASVRAGLLRRIAHRCCPPAHLTSPPPPAPPLPSHADPPV